MCDVAMMSHDGPHDPELDARHLARADEVRSDKKRFKAVQEHAHKLHRAVFGAGDAPEKKGRKRGKKRRRGGR